MHRGYIKIWRKIRESFLWDNEKALKLFLHLLMEANYKETEFVFNYKKQVLSRGQLICGRKKLAISSSLAESTVYKIMKMLEKEQLIEQQKTNLYTIVSIVNYDQYQEMEQVKEQQTIQPGIQPRNTSKELRITKKKVYVHSAANDDANADNESFESLWATYPNKLGKKQAERHYNASVKTEEDFSKLKLALNNFLKSKIAKDDPKYIPHGSTWFNNWRDWVDYKEPTSKEDFVRL